MSDYRVRASSSGREKQNSLENLIRMYLEKSDELEDKQDKVLKQMELMQSAVASLQSWQRKGGSQPTSEPVRINLKEIEEETRKIREETKRIQKEVREKIEENKRLQDQVNQRRRTMSAAASEEETLPEDYLDAIERESKRKREMKEITDGYSGSKAGIRGEEADEESLLSEEDPAFENDPRVKFFREKIHQLKKMERNLMRESEEGTRLAKAQRENLKKKIEMLEWETEIDRQLVKSLRRKYVD